MYLESSPYKLENDSRLKLLKKPGDWEPKGPFRASIILFSTQTCSVFKCGYFIFVLWTSFQLCLSCTVVFGYFFLHPFLHPSFFYSFLVLWSVLWAGELVHNNVLFILLAYWVQKIQTLFVQIINRSHGRQISWHVMSEEPVMKSNKIQPHHHLCQICMDFPLDFICTNVKFELFCFFVI